MSTLRVDVRKDVNSNIMMNIVIIDIQSFRGVEYFIPKEVAVLAINVSITGLWNSSYSFDLLETVRQEINWFTQRQS